MPWLHLDAPVGWFVYGDVMHRIARMAGSDIVLEWFPLGLLPARPIAWVSRVVGATGLRKETVTLDGWPVILVETEGRLEAFYAFLEHTGRATVSGSRWRDEERSLRACLLAARPRFDDLVLSVEGFYDHAAG